MVLVRTLRLKNRLGRNIMRLKFWASLWIIVRIGSIRLVAPIWVAIWLCRYQESSQNCHQWDQVHLRYSCEPECHKYEKIEVLEHWEQWNPPRDHRGELWKNSNLSMIKNRPISMRDTRLPSIISWNFMLPLSRRSMLGSRRRPRVWDIISKRSMGWVDAQNITKFKE